MQPSIRLMCVMALPALVLPLTGQQQQQGGRQQATTQVQGAGMQAGAVQMQQGQGNAQQQVHSGFTADFQGQEVQTVLSALAEAGRLNLSVASGVYGKYVSFRAVTPMRTTQEFIDAIQMIAEGNDLIFSQRGNALSVSAKPVLTAQQQNQQFQMEQQRRIQELNAQTLRTYQLRHITAQSAAQTVTSLFQQQAGRSVGGTNFNQNFNQGRGGGMNTNQGRGNNNAGGRGNAAGGRGGNTGGRGGRGLSGDFDLVDPMNDVAFADTTWMLDEDGVPQIQAVRTVDRAGQVTVQMGAAQAGRGGQGMAGGANLLQGLQGLFQGPGGGGFGGQFANQQLQLPRISIEATTNQLLVMANDSDWIQIEQLLRSIDLRPQQVLIEVTIAEVSRNNDLNAGLAGNVTYRSGRTLDSLGRALPAASTAREIISRFIGSSGSIDYNLALSALQTQGDVRVLSLPIIIAQNNFPAYLNVGQTLPFPATSSTSLTGGVPTTVVTYNQVGVGTTLNITPIINRDGYVNLTVSQTDNSASPDPISGSYIISNREASTSIFLRSGQTTVVGGLAGRSQTKSSTGIPVLRNIPIIGPLLFGSVQQQDRTSELFLFLTPHIISSDEDVDTMKQLLKDSSELLKDVPVARIRPDTIRPDTTQGNPERSFR